ncbi:MAG: PD40 domain-containing protein [Deltaproteobacteria bacterium]|nr:PD40 domain-containing protein [Deltaproteobacteria bacterium]
MTQRRGWLWLVCALVLGPWLARPAAANDPRAVWHTLESPHFIIHYYDPHRAVAYRVARLAERAHAELVPVMATAPEGRTHVVLTDDTDSENGSATVLPFEHVTLFITAPDATSSLGDFDDYLALLITHEYTHILHLGDMGSIPRLINAIFGRQWSPNSVAPSWYVEGLATYQESERTSAGRIRSAAFEALLRTAIIEDKFLRLDQVTNNPYEFPRGTTRYLYGSAFVKYLGDRFGDPALAKFHHAYGAEPIPFAVNRLARRVFGKTMVELWDEWAAHLRRRYAVELDEVRARGVRVGRALTSSGETNTFPRYRDDGTLVWLESNGWDAPRYAALGPGGGRPRTLFAELGQSGLSFIPGGGGSFVYERTAPHRNLYLFEDLFRYDAATRSRERLTFGLRASEPDVSPDGQRVVCVVNHSGQRRLVLLDLAAAQLAAREGHNPPLQELYTPGRFEQVYSPAWSPDGATIAFSLWSAGGFRDIALLDVATRQVRTLMHDRAQDMAPRWSRDGQTIFYGSDRSGIHNIYAYDVASGAVRQVTNVLGGALQPEPSPDGRHLVYVSQGARGTDLAELALTPASWLEPVPLVNERPPARLLPELPGGDESDPTLSKPRDYDPSDTILPRTWTVRLGRDSFGRALGLSTGGGDVIGRHSYAADASVGLARGDLGGSMFYAYTRLFPRFELSARRSVFKAGVREDVDAKSIDIDYRAVNLGVRIPLGFDVDYSLSTGAAFGIERFRSLSPAIDASLDVLEPGELRPRRPALGDRAGLNFFLAYSTVRGRTKGVALSEGMTAGINLGVQAPELGSDAEAATFTWSWNQFFQLPWGHGHAASVRYQGGLSSVRGGPVGVFFLGGVPDQSIEDIVRALIENRRIGPPALHGYPGGLIFGDQYHLLNLDWRFPVWNVERGAGTLPVYLGRMHAALFADVGTAFFGPFDRDYLRSAIGVELRQDLQLGWYLGATLVAGLSHGLDKGGVSDFYTLLSFPL